MHKGPSEAPTYYLATYGGYWCVIHGGVPICANTDEEGARRVARFAGCDITHGWIWNGDAESWMRRQ